MPSFPIPALQVRLDVEREAEGVDFTIVSEGSGVGHGVVIPPELLPPVALQLLGAPDSGPDELVDIARQSDPDFLLETARKFLLASLIRTEMDNAVPPPEEEHCAVCNPPAKDSTEAKLAEASETVQAQQDRIRQLEDALRQVAGAVNAVGS